MIFQNGIKYAKTGMVALAMAVPSQSSKVMARDVPILKNPQYVKEMRQSFIYDNPAMESYINILRFVANDIHSAQFNRALNIHKKELQKDLHLSESRYDTYKKAIDKIGREEKTVTGLSESETEPEGHLLMYRFSIPKPTENEQKLMKKYNIDYPKPDITPEQLAVRTVIHLAELDKYYPKYLAIMKEVAPDTAKTDVKNSISNAKRIMKDEQLATMAINEIDALDMNMSFIDGNTSNPLAGILSRKDLDDLKIYAKVLVLPRDEFLTQMWDRHPVIPIGKQENRACANILFLHLNKH